MENLTLADIKIIKQQVFFLKDYVKSTYFNLCPYVKDKDFFQKSLSKEKNLEQLDSKLYSFLEKKDKSIFTQEDKEALNEAFEFNNKRLLNLLPEIFVVEDSSDVFDAIHKDIEKNVEAFEKIKDNLL